MPEARVMLLPKQYLYVEYITRVYLAMIFQANHITLHIHMRGVGEGGQLLQTWPAVTVICDCSHPGCKVITHCAFDWYFLMTNKAKHLSRCPLGTRTPSYWSSSLVHMSAGFSFCLVITILCHGWPWHIRLLLRGTAVKPSEHHRKMTKVKEFEETTKKEITASFLLYLAS